MEWTDKDNCIAVIALHNCRIKRVLIFELLKPLNIMHVFVLDTGGVSDHNQLAPCGSYATGY